LGSRHNVRHWGDGAKEARISQALLKRPYYYLTADERTGDLLDEVVDADRALLNVDPLKELPGIAEEKKYRTHLRIGPDWFALESNWYAAWERTGDPKYREKIQAGIDSILALPNRIASGENYGYDPTTAKLYPITTGKGSKIAPSLLTLFGGPELNAEINPILNDANWTRAWNDFCDLHTLTGEDNARLMAYSAYVTHDPARAADAWNQFFRRRARESTGLSFDSHRLAGSNVAEPVDEIDNISTNSTSQWCLNAIELLELVGEEIPAMTKPVRPAMR